LLAAMFLAAWPPPSNPVLAPLGKWQVDYDVEQCAASRQFGDARDPVTFMIKPSPTSDVVQLLLLMKGFESSARQLDAVVTLGDAPPVKVSQLNYGLQVRTRLINLAADEASPLSRANKVVWQGRGADVELETGSLQRVMTTLEDCRKKLRDFWNISPERAQMVKQGPAPAKPIVTLFTSGHYPAQALRAGDSGTTSVMTLVDENGLVRECMIDQTSGYATLDAQTCIVIRNHARFQPALDHHGKPVRSYYGQRVRWEMPGNVPIPIDRKRRRKLPPTKEQQ